MTRTIAIALALLTFSLPIAAAAGDASAPLASSASLEAVLVASSDAPASHRALAGYYRTEASAERARAARLRSAARHLSGGKLFQISAVKAQRLSQAAMLDASAREHDLLAARHDAKAS